MLGNELLTGATTRLAVLTQDDLPVMLGWTANIELQRLIQVDVVRTLCVEDLHDQYAAWRTDSNRYDFAVRALDDDRMLGRRSARSINWRDRVCKISIMIGAPADWGRGYGSDATRVLLKFCFMELALNRVQLGVVSYNERAIHAYRKIGFQDEGVIREAARRDGRYYDILQMAILRREWETLHGVSAPPPDLRR